MAIGLFASLFVACLLMTVSLDEYRVSPANLAVDAVRRQLGLRLAPEGNLLAIVGRSMQEVVKTGIVTGTGLGLIAFMTTFRLVGPLAVAIAVACSLLGVLLTGKAVNNEYRRWQARLLAGLPTLVNFLPSFLAVDGVTAREALGYSLSFLPEPLKSELWAVLDKIRRTGRVREAMDRLAERARHPLADAICFRLSAAWDARITPDIFADLTDQVADMNELAISKTTAAKTGYLALLSVIGLIGMTLVYGYPAVVFLLDKMQQGFGP